MSRPGVLPSRGLVLVASLFALACSSDDGGDTPAPQRFAGCTGALICDDFEAQTAASAPSGSWTTNQNGGTVTVDTTRAFSGTQSVLASTPAAMAYKSAMARFDSPLLPLASNSIYGRMMFYLESAPATSVHWTFIDGSGQVEDAAGSYTAVYRYGGQLPVMGGTQFMANYETPDHYSTPGKGPSTDCYQQATGQLTPVGKWACAEWHFDGPTNSMQFWLDGREIQGLFMDGTGDGCGDQPNDYTWIAPVFTRIQVGWESYQADEARSLWIDDVALSEERIGCPAPASTTTVNPGSYY
jgi:polysaccharide lyase-like protein